ncbi:MAG: hypothetical protein QNJ97_24885 [Myxococcota bacterium]|nr:hypothetical protein [Myxococcota bacterium]
MKKLSFIGVACAFIICNVWNAQGQISEESSAQDWEDDDWDGYEQTPEEALAEDLALVAKAKGWTIEEAAADRRAADEIGRIAVQLAKKRPDIFIGSAVSEEPGGVPTLYVKGPAGRDVLDLVKSSEIEINIADRQPFSFEELVARQQKVTRSLEELGYNDYKTFFKLEEAGKIHATVAVEANLPDTAFEIVQSLPVKQRDYVDLKVSHTPLLVLEHAIGGMVGKTGGGQDWCTTGWTVGWGGPRYGSGVTTAEHCDEVSKIGGPGMSTHSFPRQTGHAGSWGEVAYHTSSSTEYPRFYSRSSGWRWTLELETMANLSVNESICVYGRFSDVRDCSLDVLHKSVSLPGGINRLVEMDGAVTTNGDSGGGWSWNNRAYGSHVGRLWDPYEEVWRNIFSFADYFDEAIGKSVKLACPGECTAGQTRTCWIQTPEGWEPGTQTCYYYCWWSNCVPW